MTDEQKKTRGKLMKNKAFTLIELLVVVLIIGILTAIAVPQYQKAVEKSRISEAITLVRSVANAEKMYHLSNNAYTNDFRDLDINFNISENTARALGSDFNLHIWRASTTNVIYAQNKINKWYIYYDLEQDKMFCSTQEEKIIPICKSFGGEELACGAQGELPCWEVKF